MKLTWTKKLSVGNSIIDSEHRNLFGMVNSMAAAIRTRDYSAVAQEYELLENWLIVHFQNEERIAQTINFDFARHKLVHQHLLKELQHLNDELAAKNGAWSDSEIKLCFHFLRELLIEHVISEDMNMKFVLQSYSYDFKHTV